MSDLVRVRTATPVTGYVIRLEFTDGIIKEIDVAPYLHGPVFDEIRADPAIFRNFTVDPRMGTVVWANGADLDPDVLYLGLTPAWIEMQVPIP